MNLNFFSLRKLIFATFIASCTVGLIGLAQASVPPDHIRDSLIGQTNPDAGDNDAATDGWLHSAVGEDAHNDSAYYLRDALVGQQGMQGSTVAQATDGWLHSIAITSEAGRPIIRDSQIAQDYPGTAPRTASSGEPVAPPASSDLGDEIAVGTALVLALLMGAALTLTVTRYTHRTA